MYVYVLYVIRSWRGHLIEIIQCVLCVGNKYIVVTAIVTSVGLAGYILWRWYPYPWNNIKERWQRNWRLRGKKNKKPSF